MSEIKKEMIGELEVYSFEDGRNYKSAMSFNNWKVAFLFHGENHYEERMKRLSRHTETDEVFVLLEGEATLIIGEDSKRIPMEKNKIYNVPKNVWHNIRTFEGAKVLIVEEKDTGSHNSDFLDVE